jgi:hypothetical protein
MPNTALLGIPEGYPRGKTPTNSLQDMEEIAGKVV